MWFKNLFKINNKSNYNRDGHNIKNSTIINQSDDKLNQIFLMVGEIKGTLKSIESEMRYLRNQTDRLDEDISKTKNRIRNLENNFYRNNRRY